MNRRAFIAGIGSAAAWPVVALAKKRSATVGVLMNGSENYASFRQGLADFGYVGEQSISLILRDAAGNSDRLDQLAAELVALDPDAIFGAGSQ